MTSAYEDSLSFYVNAFDVDVFQSANEHKGIGVG